MSFPTNVPAGWITNPMQTGLEGSSVKNDPGKIPVYTASTLPAASKLIGPAWVDGKMMYSDGLRFRSDNYNQLTKPGTTAANFRRSQKLTDINVPTPYASVGSAVVHPSIAISYKNFGGYKYWMAYTPYPGTNSEYENPCIAASNDLVTWTQIGKAPIVESPAGAGYNSDTDITFNADESMLIMVYRSSDSARRLNITYTNDGINWITPVNIISGASGVIDYGSPAIWYDKVLSRWVITSVNLANTPRTVHRSESKELLTGWSQTPVPVTMPAPAVGYSLWHIGMKLLDDGRVIGLGNSNINGAGGSLGETYFLESTDRGYTFGTPTKLSLTSHYRPMICGDYENGKDAGLLAATSSMSTIKLFRITEDKTTFDSYMANSFSHMQAVASGGAGTWDNFTRADSASSAGTPTGGAYTVSTGTWGISTNRLYHVTTGNNRLLSAAHAVTTYRSRVKIDTLGSQFYLISRFVDANNYWRFGVTALGSNYAIQKIVAGAVVAVASNGSGIECVPAAGDVLEIKNSADYIEFYVNGVLEYSSADTTHNTGVQAGVQGVGTTTTYFDDYYSVAVG